MLWRGRLGMAGVGVAGSGLVRQARMGRVARGMDWGGVAGLEGNGAALMDGLGRQGAAWFGKERDGEARTGRRGVVRHCEARCGRAWSGRHMAFIHASWR